MKEFFTHSQAQSWAVIGCVLLAFVMLGGRLSAQVTVPRSVIASGATSMSGSKYMMNATVGQPGIGTAKADSRAGFFGFWYDAEHVTVEVRTLETYPADRLHIADLYPNPAVNRVTTVITVPVRGPLDIHVYDLLGRRVRNVVIGVQDAGRSLVHIDVDGLSPGQYFLRFIWNGRTQLKTIAVLR